MDPAAMTTEEIEDLRDALSCGFGVYRVDAISDATLYRLVARLPKDLVGEATRWGWSDTVVRDEVCTRAEQLLGADNEIR